MDSWIGIVGGIVIGVIAIVVPKKIKVLRSTKSIFGIIFSFIIIYFLVVMGQIGWPVLAVFAYFSLQVFEYFKNKRLERAILNTAQYMINQKYKKEISAQEISSELGYDFEFVAETLVIYKRNAIIPYDISLNTEF